VIIDDGPLASLLADAETPAHTQWSHQTQNFREKYGRNAKAFLDFVRSAPRKLAETLGRTNRDRNRLALAQFFPMPGEADGLPAGDRDADDDAPDGNPVHPPQPPPPPSPHGFAVERVRGGFRVRRGDVNVPLPSALEVVTAYDVSRGNPFSKYSASDFQMKSLAQTIVGAGEVLCEANRLVVRELTDDFRIEVDGFDVNRDLCVRVRAREVDRD
jgi:hypothetical protein